MSEMKHTPGPWACHSDPHTEPGHPDLLRFRIQSGRRPIIDGYVLLQEDAFLMGAAPEMLEALVYSLSCDLPPDVNDTVRAAIAKAEGR